MKEYVLHEMHSIAIFFTFYCVISEKKDRHFVHIKEHKLLLSFKIFYDIMDLGFHVNATAHYRSPIFMYNVALKGVVINFQIENDLKKGSIFSLCLY